MMAERREERRMRVEGGEKKGLEGGKTVKRGKREREREIEEERES